MKKNKKYKEKGGKAHVFSGINQNRQINEENAPEYQETESDYQLGVGSDLKPMNGFPVPPEGIKEKDL